MSQHRGTFRNELARLKKGVRMAWFINFILLTFTFAAAIIVASMSLGMTMTGLVWYLIGVFGFSVIASGITIAVVNARSSKILMGAAADGNQLITGGYVHDMFEEVCLAAGLFGNKQPELYIAYGSGVINAYAVADGKGNGRVILTEEILHILEPDELRAVIAHEVGHIVAGDSVDMTKIIALTSVVGMMSGIAVRFMGFGGRGRSSGGKGGGPAAIIALVVLLLSLVFLIVAPILSRIAQNYMSRQREAQADALAVKFTRNPSPLAYALMKIDQSSAQLSKDDLKHFKDKVGALALYAPPLGGKALRTHPPTEERVKNLINMGASLDDTPEGS